MYDLGYQESNIWTVWSLCQSLSSTGSQWQQKSSWNISQKRFSCWKFWSNYTVYISKNIHLTFLVHNVALTTSKTCKITFIGHFDPPRRSKRFKFVLSTTGHHGSKPFHALYQRNMSPKTLVDMFSTYKSFKKRLWFFYEMLLHCYTIYRSAAFIVKTFPP